MKVDELNDEKAEALYQQLIEFNSNDEENVQRLRRLFDVCKSVMQIKSLQAEVAVEELEETIKNYNKSEASKKDMYKESDGRADNIGFNQTNNQIIELKNTIEAKDSENIKLKRKLNDLQNSLDLRDKEVIALRSEVESLREEIDNQRQSDDRFVEREEPLEKLREKNKQIQTLLDELREVETINLEFANQIKKLKLELNSATNELQISCNQMEMLSKQINELKQLNEDFLLEKQYLTEEMSQLKESLNGYEGGNDNIIDKYGESIKDLQKLLANKDEEIIKLKSSSLIPDEAIREKERKMSKVLEEKDKQLELLKTQLNEAVVDMESQTEIIRKLFQQNKGDEEVSKLNQKISCKTELNSKINDLEEELERKNAKLKAFQSENEELKTKRMNPNTQLKQTVEDLKEESQQKDLLISTLKKSIKDDRAMRAVSAVRRPKEDDIKRDKKVDNQLFQEIADLRAMTETQKNTIKHLEVVKWDYEKNLKELKEQMKQKAKEKEMEISELKEKIDKIKVRMNRNENEKQLLQNKVTLREKTQKNRQHKWTQTTGAVSEQDVNKLKQEMKTLRHELKERENESNVLRKSLEMSGQKESELKTLLEESVKREKLATIHEKNVECDQQYDHLLEENARIKDRTVELGLCERSLVFVAKHLFDEVVHHILGRLESEVIVPEMVFESAVNEMMASANKKAKVTTITPTTNRSAVVVVSSNGAMTTETASAVASITGGVVKSESDMMGTPYTPIRGRRPAMTPQNVEFKCTFPDCGFVTNSQEKLDFHVKAHTNTKYKCPYCPYVSNTIVDIKRHIQKSKKHEGQKVYACQQCVDIKRHIQKSKKHEGQKVYACQQCGYGSDCLA
ncbi:unnamed protein product [Oppiella nova]|uniref:C2H2-type domain-containing protein n=1 Tax=Oppiella nova TaxID=334625 RepID=A0A7R9QPD0_9ACAR|nr:unnamed protein product [Oppiella nova]CAG2170119.1 unnamed protein product [Oppiella nova]